MAIREALLVSSYGEEVRVMAAQKPKLPQETDADQIVRRTLVRKLDLSALHQPQGPDSGINAIIGKWPGDEDLDEEEFIALVEEIS
jgi:hypothetical protein